MTIRFAKGKNGKPPTLTCTRDDGLVTWQASSDVIIRHDLIHYAVETTLGYREAFFGLVAAGRDIESFGTKDGVKDTYPQEAGWAECIVGTLQWPAMSTGPEPTPEESIAAAQQMFADHNIPAPYLTPGQIARIRATIMDLHRRWEELPDDAALELSFP
jgi:hypothetical protein